MSAVEEKSNIEPAIVSGIIPVEDLKFDDVKFKTEVVDNVATLTPEDAKLYYNKAEEVGINAKTINDVNAFEAKYFKGMFDKSVEVIESTYVGDKALTKVNAVNPFGAGKHDSIGVYTR